MPFLKVVKDRSYSKRYQTKFRRRREGKTDYYARKRLIAQAKNKYNSHKYRFIVRFTNKDIVCQIAYATLAGDVIVSAAYSHELPRYGVPLGLTNYAAAYATGLLLARRVLTKFNLAAKYKGVTEITGEYYTVKPQRKSPNPFSALLDVGLARTSTGSKIFSCLKGVCDGGVRVPHSDRRFVGYSASKKELDPAVLRKYIFGGHVAAYMKLLQEKNPNKYDTQFSRYKKAKIGYKDLEKLYTEAHKKIRAEPVFQKKPEKKYTPVQLAKYAQQKKRTLRQRKTAIEAKKKKLGLA